MKEIWVVRRVWHCMNAFDIQRALCPETLFGVMPKILSRQHHLEPRKKTYQGNAVYRKKEEK